MLNKSTAMNVANCRGEKYTNVFIKWITLATFNSSNKLHYVRASTGWKQASHKPRCSRPSIEIWAVLRGLHENAVIWGENCGIWLHQGISGIFELSESKLRVCYLCVMTQVYNMIEGSWAFKVLSPVFGVHPGMEIERKDTNWYNEMRMNREFTKNQLSREFCVIYNKNECCWM